jgi:hypothetical protein
MRSRSILLLATLCIALFSSLAATAHDGCNANHKHTAAGSCKDSDNWDTSCGEDGAAPVSAGSVRFYGNQTADGAELEACNDEGAGTTHGQIVLRVNTDDQYVRFTLNSDQGQKPNVSAGYINVQAGPGADQTGVWCSSATEDADGYAKPVNDPGTEGGNTPDKWAECIPTQ